MTVFANQEKTTLQNKLNHLEILKHNTTHPIMQATQDANPRSHHNRRKSNPKFHKVLTHSRSADSAPQAEARSDSVRQRGLLGLQGVHLATLTASDAKIQEIHHAAKPVCRLCSGSVT